MYSAKKRAKHSDNIITAASAHCTLLKIKVKGPHRASECLALYKTICFDGLKNHGFNTLTYRSYNISLEEKNNNLQKKLTVQLQNGKLSKMTLRSTEEPLFVKSRELW